MSNDKRVEAGISAGGQFAAQNRDDSAVSLPIGPQCDQHGGNWGEDETCAICTSGSGIARAFTGNPRIVATFQPQYWQNDYAIDASGPLTVDVTEIIHGMDTDERAALVDMDYQTDEVYFAAQHAGLTPVHVGPSYTQVTESIAGYDTRIAGATAIGEFLIGDISALTTDTLRSVPKLNSHFPGKPQVSVHDSDQIDFIYNEDDAYGTVSTTRVTLNADGDLTGYGDGDDWEENNWQSERLASLGLGENAIRNA